MIFGKRDIIEKKIASRTKSLSAQEKQKRNTAHMVVFHLNLQKCLQLGAKKNSLTASSKQNQVPFERNTVLDTNHSALKNTASDTL